MEPLYVPAGNMSAHQAAQQLGITLSGLRDLVRRGKLTPVGGSPRQRYYDSEAVLDLYARKAA